MAEVARNVLARVGGAFSGCLFAPPKHDQETERERWDSRFAFILAACGSAIGLGNLWRFPALAFEYGGGAFFLPYLLALFMIGIPLSVLELALGQVVQSGDIACFGSMHRRLRGVGFASVFGAFMVVCYYNVIVSWACVYFVNSFQSPLPWDVPDDATGEAVLQPANDFFESTLQLTAPDDRADRIAGDLYAGLIFVWVSIAAIVWKGVSRTSKVVYVTMIVPMITLLILLIRGATLEGASDGVRAYIGEWDFSVLQNGAAWSDAVGQIFFSIGVTFGVMTAYSSYNSRFQNVVSDALIISLTNSGVSVIAGFAVFSVLGWLSTRTGIAINDLSFSGPSLAFVTYPQALAELPAANFFNILFFITLFFLGIDSAFSLVEAVCTAVKDSAKYYKVSRGTITAIVCAVGFFIGGIYLTNLGLFFLDTVDNYVSNVGMLFVGFMESFSAGWIYRLEEYVEISGQRAVYALTAAWVLGPVLGMIIGTTSVNYAGLIIGLIIVIGGSFFAAQIAEHNVPMDEDSVWRNRSRMWTLFMFPVESLRGDLNAVIKREGDGFDPDSKWAIPLAWSILMKFFIPPVLIILLCLKFDAYVQEGGVEGYPAIYQAVGTLVSVVLILMVFIPAIKPELLAGWIPNALTGAQTLGALQPIRDDEDAEVEKLTPKGFGDEDDSELSVAIGDTDDRGIELQEASAQKKISDSTSNSSIKDDDEPQKSITLAADTEV